MLIIYYLSAFADIVIVHICKYHLLSFHLHLQLLCNLSARLVSLETFGGNSRKVTTLLSDTFAISGLVEMAEILKSVRYSDNCDISEL